MRYLEFRRRGRNFGVEPRTGSSHQVNRNRRGGILRFGSLYVDFDPVDQRFVRGPEVGAAARSRIVSGASTGRPRMKIAGLSESLPDNFRTHGLTVFLDQLSIGS